MNVWLTLAATDRPPTRQITIKNRYKACQFHFSGYDKKLALLTRLIKFVKHLINVKNGSQALYNTVKIVWPVLESSRASNCGKNQKP